MAVTLKCPDCGHTVQAPDDTPRTCPECEGTMKKPAYKAKSGPTSSDRESEKEKSKAKPQAKAEESKGKKSAAKPAAAKKAEEPEPLPLDDEEAGDERGGDFTRNGAVAERLGIDPGFKNKALMRQVAEEMSRGEVLHWVARPSMEIAQKKAKWARIGGIAFGLIGVIIAVVLLALVKAAPWYVGVIVGVLFGGCGVVIALLGPKSIIKQAESGWYAVTDRRAIVYLAPLWGTKGQTTSYDPAELRKMWVKKSSWVEGGGDLIFKTEVHDNRTKWVDKRTGRTVKTTGSRTEHHYGFLGIENVREVETLVHDVLLGGADEDEDEGGDEEE